MTTSSQELPAEPDLWAPVGFEHLPRELVSAFRGGDWPQVRMRLQTVMDAMVTDGPYGRELFQLVLQLPIGFDPVFERYRASAMVDHGEWDALRNSLAARPLERTEVRVDGHMGAGKLDEGLIIPVVVSGVRLNRGHVRETHEAQCDDERDDFAHGQPPFRRERVGGWVRATSSRLTNRD